MTDNTTYVDIKVEEADYEVVIKTETEVIGGSHEYQNVDTTELQHNENDKNLKLENSVERLLNEHSELFSCKVETWDIKPFEGYQIDQRITNFSTNHQKSHENGKMHEKVGCDGKEKLSQGDLIKNVKINNKEKEDKFQHDNNDCLREGALKRKVLQKKCEKDVILNHAKDKQQQSECCGYNISEKKYKCNYKAHKLTLKCSYRTSRKDQLLAHKCNKCLYATVRKDTVLSHIKTCHIREKLFKCNECSYAAVRKGDPLTHIKSRDSMEKPYKCNECSYTAVKKLHLLSHIKSHHTMEGHYKCNECSY